MLIVCLRSHQCLCSQWSDKWHCSPAVQDSRFMACCSSASLKVDIWLTQNWLTSFACCHGKSNENSFPASVWMCNAVCGFKQRGENASFHRCYNFATGSLCSSAVPSARSSPQRVLFTIQRDEWTCSPAPPVHFSLDTGNDRILSLTQRDERETDVQKRAVI